MTGDEKVKKKRDPIFMVCLVIFVIAAIAVVGTFVNDHFVVQDDTVVAYGDTVTVDYTGTFYDEYGNENAMVFDTSYSKVGKDDSVAKSPDFSKSSYSSLSYVVGGGSVLKDFGDAAVGHKIGDKYKVFIKGEDAYPAADNSKVISEYKVPVNQTMSKSAFDSLYKDIVLTTGQYTTFKTVYGWDATAVYSGNNVEITNMPVKGETYTYEQDNKDIEVKLIVSDVAKDVTIQFDISGVKVVNNDNHEIQMIKLTFDAEPWYITNYDADSHEITYKTGEAKSNMDLFFEIKIVSIAAA